MNYKLLYIVILIVFLPAYTQVKDTVTVIRKIDSKSKWVADSLEIEKIKVNLTIDTAILSIRIKKLKVLDSINKVCDSIHLKDTCYGRTKQ